MLALSIPMMSSRHDTTPLVQSENPRFHHLEEIRNKQNERKEISIALVSASLAASDSSRLPLSAVIRAAKRHVWALSLAFLLALDVGLDVPGTPGNNHPALWDAGVGHLQALQSPSAGRALSFRCHASRAVRCLCAAAGPLRDSSS